MGTNTDEPNRNTHYNMNTTVNFKPIFQLLCDIDYGDNNEYTTEDMNIHISLGGHSRTPLMTHRR